MSRYDYPDVSVASVRPVTEEQLAAQLTRDGETVRLAHGRYWREYSGGFFEPVHRMARLSAGEARRPGLCWGFRATLDEAAATAANASLPMHLIVDIAAHDASVLPRDARYNRNKQARQGVRIVQAIDLQVIRDQGYEVMLDWWQRIPRRGAIHTRERYLAELGRRVPADGWLTLAALDGDRLLGFQQSQVVDDTAYMETNTVTAMGLDLGLSGRLDFEATQVFRRNGSIVRATSGVYQPEMPRLAAFKVRHGFPVVRVPSRFWMLKPMELVVRARRPLTYYRLTGRGIDRAVGH